MTRRPGVTLTESLVALFVAALGMISLLTLFPLGALQMGQAFKDSRCGQSAQQADGLMRWYWSKYETDPNSPTSVINTAFDRGDNLPTVQWLQPSDRRPSYPVFVDPIGKVTTWPAKTTSPVATAAQMKNRMAGLQYVPRHTISILPLDRSNDAAILRFCMLQDDLTYDGTNRSGAPRPQVSATDRNVERGGRYNWAWMLQRPDNSRRGLVNMTVVVYDQRAVFSANSLTEQGSWNVAFYPGTTSVRLDYDVNLPRPAIRKGTWILDATLNANFDPNQPIRHANFYRVASVNDESNGTYFIELDNPIRRNDGWTIGYGGDLVVLNGVAEVFERPAIVTGNTTP